jgi:protein-S-isoprenylcysteine O-methyltransferase Ste14
MDMPVIALIDYSWIAVGIVWLLAASTTKRAAKRYAGPGRVFQMALLLVAFLLMFYRRIPLGPLEARVVPLSPASTAVGAVLAFGGLLFALWARFYLGRNWSAEITVKQDHQLIRTGPYAVVRHPIYSGFLFALLGTAIDAGVLRGFLALALAGAGWRLKSLVEERFMEQQFGAEYASYKRDVKALVPFIW